MRGVRRIAAVSVTAMLSLGALVACGGGSGSEALVVYSGRSEGLVGPVIDRFTEETGIAVDVRYGDSAAMSAQIAEEGSNTNADVFYSQDAGALGALAAIGALAPLPSTVSADVPAAYRTGEWVGVTARARTLVYNSDTINDPPRSVFALTGPRYRDQVAIAPTNASFQSFVTAMREMEGEERTKKWLEDLIANGAKSYENNLAVVDAVNAGQAGVGLVNHYYWYVRAQELGENNLKVAQEFMEPGDPGSLVNVSGVAVTPGNETNQDAVTFINFLLSPDIQTYFAEQTFEYPTVDGIPGPDGAPSLASLGDPPVDLNALADLAGTQALLREVGLI